MPDDISRDELEWWLEQQHEQPRTFHPGCVIVVAVCVIIWLAAILGAVQLYKRSPLDPIIVTPPPESTYPPYPLVTRTIDGTPTVIMPEDVDAP